MIDDEKLSELLKELSIQFHENKNIRQKFVDFNISMEDYSKLVNHQDVKLIDVRVLIRCKLAKKTYIENKEIREVQSKRDHTKSIESKHYEEKGRKSRECYLIDKWDNIRCRMPEKEISIDNKNGDHILLSTTEPIEDKSMKKVSVILVNETKMQPSKEITSQDIVEEMHKKILRQIEEIKELSNQKSIIIDEHHKLHMNLNKLREENESLKKENTILNKSLSDSKEKITFYKFRLLNEMKYSYEAEFNLRQSELMVKYMTLRSCGLNLIERIYKELEVIKDSMNKEPFDEEKEFEKYKKTKKTEIKRSRIIMSGIIGDRLAERLKDKLPP